MEINSQYDPMSIDLGVPLVIDNGSCTTKAGFSGSDVPQSVFPSIVGRHRGNVTIMIGFAHKDTYIGEEAHSKRNILSNNHPIENGLVTNWDDMEKLWHHTFYNELRVAPEEHPVLLTESPLNPKFNREKMTQIMFETFCTPVLYVTSPAVLSLLSHGQTSGIVLDSGFSSTHVVPVYEGHALPHAISRCDVGGREVTSLLQKLFSDKGHEINADFDEFVVTDIKEKRGYVALNPYQEEWNNLMTSHGTEISYKLPDDSILVVGSERFQCTEVLFQPSILGMESAGFHETIFSSIARCDAEIRERMYKNIVLSGGNSMFYGMEHRLRQELNSLMPLPSDAKIRSKDKNSITAWIGGSMLSSLSTFRDMCASKQDFNEYGPRIVHRKCF